MSKIGYIFLVLIIFFILSCKDQTTVFILSSYDNKDVCGKPQIDGAIEALNNNIKNPKIEITYLDSRRNSNEEVEKKCEEFIKKVRILKPKLIITNDDPAFQCAFKNLLGNKIPVIFSGINIAPEQYNEKRQFLENRKPIKNFTGIYENIFILKNIELVEAILGKVEKIAILYSDDLMGNILKEQALSEVISSQFKGKIVLYKIKTLSDLARTAEEINKRKDISAYFPFVMSIKEEKVLTINEIAPILIKKIKKPEIAINKLFVDLGFLGGVSVDFYNMGYRAGEMASYIISGIKINDLKVENANKYVKILNYNRAKNIKLNLPDNKLALFDEIEK